MSASSYGKGSSRRPSSISEEEFSQRWEMAFGRSKGLDQTGHDDSENDRQSRETGRAS